MQNGCQSEYALPVGPARDRKRVSRRHEQRAPVAADPAWRPDAAAAPARRPACELLRILQGHTQDPAVILAAVPEVAAERHVDRAVENGQCTPLVLVAGVEALAASLERLRHVDGPARQDRAVLEREREDPMPPGPPPLAHGIKPQPL